MSNSKGVFMGVFLRCEVEKTTLKSSVKRCPCCDTPGIAFCPSCGTKTEHTYIEKYPTGSMLYDGERLVWLRNLKCYERGILCMRSNVAPVTLSLDTDHDADATLVLPGMICRAIYEFEQLHALEIAQLVPKCKRVTVEFGVVPWYEF